MYYSLLISGIFCLIFSGYGWPQVTETTDSETVDWGRGTTVKLKRPREQNVWKAGGNRIRQKTTSSWGGGSEDWNEVRKVKYIIHNQTLIYYLLISYDSSSVQFSYLVMSDSLRPDGLQHTRLPCPSPSPGVCSNSCPSSRWCHPTISSSVIHLQSFPASGSFPRSQFFALDGQSNGVSASASVLPMNIQDWFCLGFTSLISLQSKGFSRVFSSTTVQKHQFFSAQFSLWSNSHIHMWLLEKS